MIVHAALSPTLAKNARMGHRAICFLGRGQTSQHGVEKTDAQESSTGECDEPAKVNECYRLFTTVVTSEFPSFVRQSGSPNKSLEIVAETRHNPEIWNCLMGYSRGVL
jgi:hypothetical protein